MSLEPKNFITTDSMKKINSRANSSDVFKSVSIKNALFKTFDNLLNNKSSNNETKNYYQNNVDECLFDNPNFIYNHSRMEKQKAEILKNKPFEKLLSSYYETFIKKDLDKNMHIFSIPISYSFNENTRLICEIPNFNRSFFSIYENYIYEHKFKNGSVHKLFSDGTFISTFPNKDVRIIFENGDIFYKFRAIGAVEFIYHDEGYSFIKYKNNQLEKILRNGIRIIKNPNSDEIRIIDLNDFEFKKLNKDAEFLVGEIKVKKGI